MVTCQASLSSTISRSLLKFMSIESVMLSNHLILCRPFLLSLSIFPSIRVFSNKLALHIRWPKYWSFRFSICPSNEYSGLTSFRIDWFYLFGSPQDFQESSPELEFETSYLDPKPVLTCFEKTKPTLKRGVAISASSLNTNNSLIPK